MAADVGRVHQKVHKDRIITAFPKCFHEGAAIEQKQDFDPRTLQMCKSQQFTNVG